MERKLAYEMTTLSVCLYPSPVLNQRTDMNQILYESYAINGHDVLIFNSEEYKHDKRTNILGGSDT
jgi:hypothetical protein